MKKLFLAYFGSPDFSAWFLEKLLNDKAIPVEVALIVTQKDKPVGRKQTLTQSPVKQIALQYKIPVFHASEKLENVDLGLLFAYGEMLPKHILSIPKYGFWNVHPSLLPLYRGPSPVANPLMEGAKKTGVTLIKMDEKADHGPIIMQQKTDILPKEKRPELSERLSKLGYELFKRVMLSGSPMGLRDDMLREQDHDRATYTKLLTKQDGYIEISNFKFQISNSPEKLFNRFRGLYPWPGIWTQIRIKGKVKRVKIPDMDFENGKLVIKKVQLEGKKEVDYDTFCKAYNLELY